MSHTRPSRECQQSKLKFATILSYGGVGLVQNGCRHAVWNTAMLVNYSTMTTTSPKLLAGMTSTSLKSLADCHSRKTPYYHSLSDDYQLQDIGMNAPPIVVYDSLDVFFLLLLRLVRFFSFSSFYRLSLERDHSRARSISK